MKKMKKKQLLWQNKLLKAVTKLENRNAQLMLQCQNWNLPIVCQKKVLPRKFVKEAII